MCWTHYDNLTKSRVSIERWKGWDCWVMIWEFGMRGTDPLFVKHEEPRYRLLKDEEKCA